MTSSASRFIDQEVNVSGDTATDVINRAIQTYAWFMRMSAKGVLAYSGTTQIVVPEIEESLKVKFTVNVNDTSLRELANFQVQEGDYFLSCALEVYGQIQQNHSVVHLVHPMNPNSERVTLR